MEESVLENQEMVESDQEVVTETYVPFNTIRDSITEDPVSALLLILTFIAPFTVSLLHPKSFHGQVLHNFAHIIASEDIEQFQSQKLTRWDTEDAGA